MPDLYPEFDETLLDTAGSNTAEYKRSYYFDFNKMDFARTGGGKIRESTGTEAWEQWCMKAIMTARYSRLAYSTDYGSEVLDSINTPDRKEAESNLRRTIVETLKANARTDRVDDMQITALEPDAWQVSCRVVGVDGQVGHINVKLGGENAWRD
jgi:hypothetical protein